eukprot:393276-Pyramimonas_sp.AAC.1
METLRQGSKTGNRQWIRRASTFGPEEGDVGDASGKIVLDRTADCLVAWACAVVAPGRGTHWVA